MGKKIDIFILSIVCAAAAYFYFYGSFRNRLIAFCLAIFIFTVFSKLIRRFMKTLSGSKWMMKRRLHKNADRFLLNLACADRDEASAAVSAVIAKAYHETCRLELLQQHPSTGINENTLFERWKAHRGEEKLIICSTGRADDKVHLFARELKKPKVALIDASALSELISEFPEAFRSSDTENSKEKRCLFRKFRFALINRKNAPRTIILSVSMLLMYFLSFGKLYLIASVLLIVITAVSLRYKGKPSRLF